MIRLWLSVQMLPFLGGVVLPNHRNKVYRHLFSSGDQRVLDFHPTLWFLQQKKKEVFLECLCNHYLQFRHPWKGSLNILHSQTQCAFFLKHKLVLSFTNFARYLYTVHPTNLLIILVKQWDRALILWPTDPISYLCQRRPVTGDDQSFLKKILIRWDRKLLWNTKLKLFS